LRPEPWETCSLFIIAIYLPTRLWPVSAGRPYGPITKGTPEQNFLPKPCNTLPPTENRRLETGLNSSYALSLSEQMAELCQFLSSLAGKCLRRDFLHFSTLQVQHPVAAARKTKIVGGNERGQLVVAM